MTLKDIAKLRMYNQGIGPSKAEVKKFKKPEDVVRHFGAVQAQDYGASLWAISLRMSTEGRSASGGIQKIKADVEKAVANKEIVRMWPMRGTIHWHLYTIL